MSRFFAPVKSLSVMIFDGPYLKCHKISIIGDIIIPCLTKVGQNIFAEDSDKLSIWLESLNENYLYKALLKAHTAEDL